MSPLRGTPTPADEDSLEDDPDLSELQVTVYDLLHEAGIALETIGQIMDLIDFGQHQRDLAAAERANEPRF